MLIERNIGPLMVADDATIEEALRRITINQRRAVFCVDGSGVLVGIVTDGDFRRWLLKHPGVGLDVPAGEVANRDLVSLPRDAGAQEIEDCFSERVTLVPLVDDRRRLVAVARPRTRSFWIGRRALAADAPCFVIAEIGLNHNGSVDVARRLVDVAAEAGADCAKLQMRDMASLYRNAGAAGDFREDLGPQYILDLLDRFSFTVDETMQVLDHCRAAGLEPLCTPWDLESARILDQYGVPAFKVASADLTNHDLLAALADTARPLIMSTGMSTEEEIVESVGVLREGGAPFALLQCNSTYPTPFRDVHLRYMDRLANLGDCLVGYSGHERGFHVALAAVARGAKIVEKHITFDKAWEGTDHKVSLLPDELTTMVRHIRDVEEAMGNGTGRTPTQGEVMNRVNLAKSLVARRKIAAAEPITDDMVDVRSPGRGLQPNRRRALIGRVAGREMEVGDFFFEGDLADQSAEPRAYKFGRPWGLPVRYHDWSDLAGRSNPDLLEFHMSYRDLELEVDRMVPESLELGLVVHSPELFSGDHLLDLASPDPATWTRSIAELQRVIDVTRALAPKFRVTSPPLIVVNVGGFSANGPRPSTDRPGLYERVAAGLGRLDASAVELIAQTMPPFPWLLGGQMFHNLFLDPEDAARASAELGVRLCLDISHTKLACNEGGLSFAEAVEMLAPRAAHLHVVDASGIDGEGLQVGEGEVDFHILAEQLGRLAPGASFIPEIWQGHQNQGEGFWIALDRLERYL